LEIKVSVVYRSLLGITGVNKNCNETFAWKENIKIYHKSVGCNAVEWIIFPLGILPILELVPEHAYSIKDDKFIWYSKELPYSM